MNHNCARIVLTGGPGGGKTELMRELRAEDPHAERWILVPEAAPLLFQAGLDGREKRFQWAVVQLQIALEDICAKSVRPNQVIICHWPDMVVLGPRKAVFTGGEPLLRSDILDLLRGLRNADPEHHVLCCLNTNGHFVTPELARELVGLADEVRVSLDAMPERNDAIRSKGNFEAAVRALECYYAVGFEPKVLITVTSHSLPDLEELLCFLIKKKITRINLNGFRPIGRGKGHREWRAEPKEIQTAVKRAWERCCPDQLPPPEPFKPEIHRHCGVGQFLNIFPNGDVFPCHVLTDLEFRIGNVREQSLLDICRLDGLLGELAALDFQELASQDERLSTLTRPGTCMGSVYAETKSLPVWSNNLPSLSVTPSTSKLKPGVKVTKKIQHAEGKRKKQSRTTTWFEWIRKKLFEKFR